MSIDKDKRNFSKENQVIPTTVVRGVTFTDKDFRSNLIKEQADICVYDDHYRGAIALNLFWRERNKDKKEAMNNTGCVGNIKEKDRLSLESIKQLNGSTSCEKEKRKPMKKETVIQGVLLFISLLSMTNLFLLLKVMIKLKEHTPTEMYISCVVLVVISVLIAIVIDELRREKK